MPPQAKTRTRPSHRRSLQPWLILLGVLAAATVAGLVLDRYVGLTGQAMLYVLAVAITANRLTWLPSAIGAVLAVPLLNFFFVPPKYTFAVDSPEHLLSLAAMLTVALSISHLSTGLRRETEMARLNERRARQLEAFATELGATRSASEIRQVTRRVLDSAFPGPCAVALLNANGELELDPDADAASASREALLACIREAASIGPGTDRWTDLKAWYIPLRAGQTTAGAASISNVGAADANSREHAQAICALAAQAALRLKLAADMRAAEEHSRWQRAQNTFLAAISHDFRTPLATIVGAASLLRGQQGKLPVAEQLQLLDAIEAEARHLSALTDNTLQLARLNNAGEVRMDWESVEEIVGSVLARIRLRDGGQRVRAQVPAGLPLIKADPVLLAQALENLLDNALKYSADAIELEIRSNDRQLTMAVHDLGSGIGPDLGEAAFEPFRRGDHDGARGQEGPRGSGLGLALCRAIARAHGGDLVLQPRAAKGTSALLRLPVQAQPSPDPA